MVEIPTFRQKVLLIISAITTIFFKKKRLTIFFTFMFAIIQIFLSYGETMKYLKHLTISMSILFFFALSVTAKDISIKFEGPEIYKTLWDIPKPVIADINLDGKKDFIIIDRFKGKLLFYLRGTPDKKKKSDDKDLNKITYDKKFKIESFLAEDEIISVVNGTLYSKKEINIIYTTGSSKIGILKRLKNGTWKKKDELDTPLPINLPGNILINDFNDDGLKDIAVLTVKGFTLLYQGKDAKFGFPIHYPIDKTVLSRVVHFYDHDLNKDKKPDLSILLRNSKTLYRYRTQKKGTSFSPEHQIYGEKIADGFLSPLKRKDKDLYLTAIRPVSKSLSIEKLKLGKSDNKKSYTRPIQVYLPKKDSAQKTVVSDANKDGILDLYVSDPMTSKMKLYLTDKKGGISSPESYSTFMDVQTFQAIDFDDDKVNELYVFSRKENLIGKSIYASGKLEFPKPLRLKGTIDSFTIVTLNDKGQKALVYICTEKNEKTKKKESYLHFIDNKNADIRGSIKLHKTVRKTNVKGLDLNNDKITDFIIFEKFNKPFVLLSNKDSYNIIDYKSGNLGVLADSKIKPSQISFSKKLGPLYASLNFVRQFTFENKKIKTINQFNSIEDKARIKTYAIDEEKMNLFLFNELTSSLEIYKIENGLAKLIERMKIEGYAVEDLKILDMNKDGQKDVVLTGKRKIGVCYKNKDQSGFTPVATFENSDDDELFYELVTKADLFNSTYKGFIAADTDKRKIELFYITKTNKIRSFMSFEIFEEKHFSNNNSGSEPRYIISDDFDGNGKNDIFMVVHNKLLFYYQK